MAGFIRCIATDFDGTLTEHDRLDTAAIDALDRLRDDGMAGVLITGRIVSELDRAYPGLRTHFDAVVAENGGVLVRGELERDLATPVEPALTAALVRDGIEMRPGRVLLAGEGADAEAVVAEIGALGLDSQVVRNRGALMVLPAGVSKASGLLSALDELAISPHNAVAVGDAENDLALLRAAEIGVAVANAVPSLREHADLVLAAPDGAGVAALLSGPIVAGAEIYRPMRRRTVIGHFDDGSAASIPAWPANVLICGETGAGKSHLAGLLIEQWITAGYRVLVIDIEGDHIAVAQLPNTVVIDSRPSPTELRRLLRRPQSVVLDVSTMGPDDRLAYLKSLPAMIEDVRAAWGVPHWIIVDEAHATLSVDGIAADVFRPVDRGYCLVTYHPELLCTEARMAIDVTLTARREPSANGSAPSPRVALVQEAGAPERTVILGPRRTPHVRHWHKYASATLPEGHWFRFRRPTGEVAAIATNLSDFDRILSEIGPDVIDHHLAHGDFSRWILGALQDRELAAAIGALERNAISRRAFDVRHARRRVRAEIASHLGAAGAGGTEAVGADAAGTGGEGRGGGDGEP